MLNDDEKKILELAVEQAKASINKRTEKDSEDRQSAMYGLQDWCQELSTVVE